MRRITQRGPYATVLTGLALLALAFGLLGLFHGVGEDDSGVSLCPGTVLLAFVVTLAFDRAPGRRVRPAPAFAFQPAALRLPDPPPKIRPRA